MSGAISPAGSSKLTIWRKSCLRDESAPLKCQCLSQGTVFKAASPKSDFFNGWPEPLEGELLQLGVTLFESVECGDVDGVLGVVHACKEQFDQETAVALLSVRRANDGNEFPLSIAAGLGDVMIIEALMENGCCLACQNNCSESALHIAAMLGCVEAVQILLDYGLDVLLHTPHAEIGDVLIDRVLAEIHELAEDDLDHSDALEQVAEQLLAAGASPSPKVLDFDLGVFSKRLANILIEQQHKQASSQLSQQLQWHANEAKQDNSQDKDGQNEIRLMYENETGALERPCAEEMKESGHLISVACGQSGPNFALVPPQKTLSPQKKKNFVASHRALKPSIAQTGEISRSGVGIVEGALHKAASPVGPRLGASVLPRSPTSPKQTMCQSPGKLPCL